jgi:hypothetical protein
LEQAHSKFWKLTELLLLFKGEQKGVSSDDQYVPLLEQSIDAYIEFGDLEQLKQLEIFLKIQQDNPKTPILEA